MLRQPASKVKSCLSIRFLLTEFLHLLLVFVFFDLLKVSKITTNFFDLFKIRKMTIKFFDLFKVSKITTIFICYFFVYNKIWDILSSVKWSYVSNYLRCQGKNFLSFPYMLFRVHFTIKKSFVKVCKYWYA